jgi:hypothetical protein
MTLRRLASLSLLTASLSLVLSGCVVRGRGGGGGGHNHARRAHHHCHNNGRCHTHPHQHVGPNGGHNHQ